MQASVVRINSKKEQQANKKANEKLEGYANRLRQQSRILEEFMSDDILCPSHELFIPHLEAAIKGMFSARMNIREAIKGSEE